MLFCNIEFMLEELNDAHGRCVTMTLMNSGSQLRFMFCMVWYLTSLMFNDLVVLETELFDVISPVSDPTTHYHICIKITFLTKPSRGARIVTNSIEGPKYCYLGKRKQYKEMLSKFSLALKCVTLWSLT